MCADGSRVPFAATAFAETGDVAGVIQSTWQSAAQQIKTVVNTVVFPALDLILVIAFFVKAGTTYYEYRKHGQIEWTGLILLFAGLVLTPDGAAVHLDHCGGVNIS